jgi:putative peptide zinc metalloprotease protein
MRPDLVVRPQRAEARHAWIVKDPVALRYFSLSTHEYAILQWLDGSLTLDDICRKFEETFPPYRMTPRRLQAFLANLYENGLLVVDGADQGKLLLESFQRDERRERWQKWLNWLSIRFRGIDPDPLLSWLYPKVRWCFSRAFLAAGLMLAVVAIVLLVTHAPQFAGELPRLHELIGPRNLVWLVVAFAVIKVLHEFGHALACKHYGGECHEMGVMLLLFVPCLYCNVTDSWMLQSRWQRIAISAAGILVELHLAALAVVCWWLFQPGLLQTIALNTIVVCSVGTIVFNGNPLLRYDGYFILADLVDMPNLWQESRNALRRRLGHWFLAPEIVARTPPGERQGLLTLYGIASLVYRAFVVVAILLLLHRALVPRGLAWLVPIIVASFVASAAVVWFGVMRRFWTRPMAWRQFNLPRVVLTAVAAAIGLWLFLAIPFPSRIAAPALLQPLAAHRIYVSTPGTLRQCVSPGDSVTANQVVAELEDVELHRDIVRLTGELELARTRVQNLQLRLPDEPDAAAQLQVAEEMLADVDQQLRQRKRDEQALILKAPAAGLVMEPPETPVRSSVDGRLPLWTGQPMKAENRDCHLERGTLFCLVGDPRRLEAVLYVDETDVQFVRIDQRVRLQFAVAPTAVLTGRVVEIAKRNILTVPNELAAEQELATRRDSTGSRRPLRTAYSVRVELDEHDTALLTASRGRAKISVEPRSLAERLVHSLRRALTVEL